MKITYCYFGVIFFCQEYTKLDDRHPRVQQRIKKLDPAEHSNMANPNNFSRYNECWVYPHTSRLLIITTEAYISWLNVFTSDETFRTFRVRFVRHFGFGCWGENGLEKFFRPKLARHFRDLAAHSRPRVLQFGSSLVYLSKFLSNKFKN